MVYFVMKMKSLLSLFFLLVGYTVFSQSTLQFCVEAGKGDSCLHPTTEFDITKDGGTVSLFVKPEDSIGTAQLVYRIYFVDAYGNEKEAQTIEQSAQPAWTYAWQDVVFYDSGTYKVKVFRRQADETLLCSGIVKIFKE